MLILLPAAGYGQPAKQQYIDNHRHALYKDSLRKAEKQYAVNELERKYHTAAKDRQLLQQQLLLRKHQDEIHRKNALLVTGISLSFLLIALLMIMHRNYQSRHRIYLKNRDAHLQLRELESLNAIIQGEENERLKLAGSLQEDIVGKLELIHRKIAALPGQYDELGQSEIFSEIRQQINVTIVELQQIMQNLIPDMILQHGLYKALASFCASVRSSTGLAVDYNQTPALPVLEPETAVSVYRIVQELLHNIIKHAEALHISVQCLQQDKNLEICISDDGKGFTKERGLYAPGMGIENIDARVNALNGTIETEQSMLTGTKIRMIFSLEEAVSLSGFG